MQSFLTVNRLGPIALPIAIGRLEHLTHNQRVLGSSYITFKMPFVYILFSPTANSFYTGVTSDDVDLRLEKHLSEHYGKAYTSVKKDWEVFMQIECNSIHLALKIERHIKKMKSKKYINDLKKYPEIIDRLKGKLNPDSTN